MQHQETSPSRPISKEIEQLLREDEVNEAIPLLLAIRNYIDAGKGYFPTIGASAAILNANLEQVREYLSTLHENHLIIQVPGAGTVAVNITNTGLELLIAAGYPPNKNWTVREAAGWLADETIGRALVWLLGLHRLDG